jgi:hypothetical protein
MQNAEAMQGFPSGECPSGIHLRADAVDHGAVQDLAAEARRLTPGCLTAVVLGRSCGKEPRAAIATAGKAVRIAPPGIPARLLLWSGSLTELSAIPVPLVLQAVLPMGMATIVPIATPAWHAGAIITASSRATESRLGALKALAAEFALRLEQTDRRCSEIPNALGYGRSVRPAMLA